MDLLPELFLRQTTNRMGHVLREGLINLILVVVHSGLRVLQVLDIVEHVEGVLQGHQVVVHLIEPVFVRDDLLEEHREERSVPVEEPAPGGFSDDDLPAADHLKLVVPVLDLLELALVENVGVDQAQAVGDDSFAELVVATFVALDDIHHELHHVVLDVPLLLLHGVDLLHAALDLAHDELASVPIDQDDPLVDEELLGLELDFNGFEHLNSLNDDLKGRFGHDCVIFLEQQKVDFEATLDLCGQLDTIGDLIRSNFQEVLVHEHGIGVLQTVRVHENNPLD